MIEPGLLSITFRALSPEHIIKLAAEAKLSTIEWGGDIHVPHGDITLATQIARQTADAGLRTSAYGSYYRAAVTDSPSFEAVLDSASALGTDIIRIWAGNIGSADVPPAQRDAVVNDIARCCDLAAARGITVATEFHSRTLTDDVDSTLALINAVDRPNFGTFWQPPVAMPAEPAVAGLKRVLPWVLNLHAFHWWPDSATRQPLAAGAEPWRLYLDAAGQSPKVHHVSLEFVKGDDVEQFKRDAATLRGWLGMNIGQE